MRARRDIAQIWSYIAQDNERAADSFIDRLFDQFRLLGRHPEAGRRRDELRPGYRSLSVGEYLVFYKIIKPGIRISHVVHGRRDLPRYGFDK